MNFLKNWSRNTKNMEINASMNFFYCEKCSLKFDDKAVYDIHFCTKDMMSFVSKTKKTHFNYKPLYDTESGGSIQSTNVQPFKSTSKSSSNQKKMKPDSKKLWNFIVWQMKFINSST